MRIRKYDCRNVSLENIAEGLKPIAAQSAPEPLQAIGYPVEGQLARLAERFAALAPETTRIVVVHHPFGHAATKHERDIVGRATLAVEAFSKSRIDIVLAGHLHAAHVGASSERYDIEGYAALLIQAGTATSTRRRGEANSFNIIRIARPHVELDRRTWKDSEGFVGVAREKFEFGVRGWAKAPHLDGIRLQ